MWTSWLYSENDERGERERKGKILCILLLALLLIVWVLWPVIVGNSDLPPWVKFWLLS